MKRSQYLALLITFIISVTITNAQEESKKTPEFTGYHFLNRNNEIIIKGTKVTKADKYIYLIIETLNAFGEVIVLNLEEDEGDYIHKNKYLTSKNSVRVKVKKDAEKIKLIIYNSNKKRHKRLREKAEIELLLQED